MDRIFTHYSQGICGDFPSQLEQAIRKNALFGDEVQLAKALSHYGCVQIYLSNEHKLATIYNQIRIEYDRGINDPRISAGYTRFLALYSLFAGCFEEAATYYKEAQTYYQQIDWHEDEVIMILEANYWLYFFTGDWVEAYSSLERLYQLNLLHAGRFTKQIDCFQYCLTTYQGNLRDDFVFDKPDINESDTSESDTNESDANQLDTNELDMFEVIWFVKIRTQLLQALNSWTGSKPAKKPAKGHAFFYGQCKSVYLELEQGIWQAVQDMERHRWLNAESKLLQVLAKAKVWRHPWYLAVVHLLIGIVDYYSNKNSPLHFKEANKFFAKIQSIELANFCEQLALGKPLSKAITSLKPGNPLPQFFSRLYKFDKEIQSKSKFSFSLFEKFQAYCCGDKVCIANWGRKKAEEILLFLLIQPEYVIGKDIFIEQIFGDCDVNKASNQLYVLIHQINKVLQKVFSEHVTSTYNLASIQNEIVLAQVSGGKVFLNKNLIEAVDVQNYLKLVSIGKQLWLQDREAAVELFQKARSIYSNQLLVDHLYFDWLDRFREQIKTKQAFLLKKLILHWQQYNNLTEVANLYEELIQIDPTDERFWLEFIHFLLKNEKKAEAKVLYNKYRIILRQELGLEPSTEIQKITGF